MTEADNTTMEFWGHLNELRKRLFVAVLALIVTTGVSFTVARRFIEILARPIGGLDRLQAIEVTESIGVFMRVSLLGGVILAMPVIVYELLLFVMPGLTRSEKKWIFLAVPMASVLFLGGVVFSYFIMLPAAVPFLVDFLGITATIRISNYINFVTNLMFWIGVSFEMPLLIFILAKLKIVNAGMLFRQWRVALVVIAIIAAVVTPTIDPVNMGILMLPLFGLYLLSILLALVAR